MKHGVVDELSDWPYSNYLEWVGLRNGKLVDRAFVVDFFPEPGEYGEFVDDYLRERDVLPDGLGGYLYDD